MDILTDTSTITEVDLLAERIARPLLERIHNLDRLADQLKLELGSARTELVQEKSKHAKDVEWYIGKATLLQEEKSILEEQIAELLPRPKEHQHDPDEPRPVITFDFDGTVKPQISKGDGGNYPLTDKYSDPFPQVKKWMDRWKSRGACLHLATAGLYYDGPAALEVYYARLAMINGWYKRYGLPFDIVLPNIPADAYYDDRMTEVPGDPSMTDKLVPPPDWDEIGETVEQHLDRRFELNEFGIWERKNKKRIGTEIEDWPDADLFKDRPRGYSGGRVDVDMHRTLSQASSSMRVAPPMEYAVESMHKMFRDGITLYVSCAGWNPKTHSLMDSIRRLAGIRQWLQKWSIPYDRVTSKDHADEYINDKGVKRTAWKDDLPRIYEKLPKTISYVT